MMKKLLEYLAVVLAVAGCSKGGGSGSMDWNVFRGDSSLSGYTDQALPSKPRLLWSFTTGPRTEGSPVVKDGVTYWFDRRGKMYGVDPDGVQVFEKDFDTFIEATPLINGDVLYIGTTSGSLLAMSLPDGDILWEYETEGQISASPNLASFAGKAAVVVGSYDNWMYCIDAEDGSLLSRYESGYYLNGAAACWRQEVLFGGCDQWLRMIDCATGGAVDSLRLDAYIPSSPAISGDMAYVGDYSGNLYAVSLQDGKMGKWSKLKEATEESSDYVSVPAVDSKAVYAFSSDRQLNSYSRKDGSLNWSVLLKGNPGQSSPLVYRDKVIACTKNGIVCIFDKSDGSLLWEYDAGEDIIASPAVIKDRFMILTAKGTLLCFGK